jgi:hypothetical protein
VIVLGVAAQSLLEQCQGAFGLEANVTSEARVGLAVQCSPPDAVENCAVHTHQGVGDHPGREVFGFSMRLLGEDGGQLFDVLGENLPLSGK